MSDAERSAKTVTRRAVRASRAARDEPTARAVEDALAAQAEPLLHNRAGAVALYRSLPGEPGTRALRAELRRAGHPVLLPVLLPDRDLDWVRDVGEDRDGDPLRPVGERLGRDALAGCVLVLVPALAVDAAGTRLGQGGGSFDRALARLAPGPGRPRVLAVVHDDEVLDGPLPRLRHDVPVDGALTPSGVHLFRR